MSTSNRKPQIQRIDSPLFISRLHSEAVAGNHSNTTNLKLSPPFSSNSPQTQQHSDNIDINSYYSLHINTIPPYVLQRLSHYDIDISLNDPFVSTFKDASGNVNWGEFLQALKYPSEHISPDIHTETSCNVQNSDLLVSQSNPNSSDPSNPESTHQNKNTEQIVDDVFKNYDLNSKWKGGHRLKGLFGSPTVVSDHDDDESDVEPCSSNSSESSNLNNVNRDLEKGGGRSKRAKLYRLDRERDIKERAKVWLEENKKTWKPKLFQSIMSNSYLPLFFRLFSLCLTTIALGLSAWLVKVTKENHVTQQPSPLMALVVQSVSVLYLIYITYDEFSSQPLGLRNPRAKIRLILFDLVFIIFSAANAALCFQSIYDKRWVCSVNMSTDAILYDPNMCVKVKALTAFILLALFVMCVNFNISVFRVVHTVSYRVQN